MVNINFWQRVPGTVGKKTSSIVPGTAVQPIILRKYVKQSNRYG